MPAVGPRGGGPLPELLTAPAPIIHSRAAHEVESRQVVREVATRADRAIELSTWRRAFSHYGCVLQRRGSPEVVGGETQPVLAPMLAALLVASGAKLVVVGGAARHLRGEQWLPLDLDVVLDGRACSVNATASALVRLGAVVPVGIGRRRSWSVETSLAHLDVLDVMPTSALPASMIVDVAGVHVPVDASG